MKEKEKVNIPWKELVKPGVIVYSVLYLLLIFIVIYFGLPFLNLKSGSFYFTLLLIINSNNYAYLFPRNGSPRQRGKYGEISNGDNAH